MKSTPPQKKRSGKMRTHSRDPSPSVSFVHMMDRLSRSKLIF